MSSAELSKLIDKISRPTPGWEPLAPSSPVGARPGEVAVGRPASSSTAGGLSLTEEDASTRQYYETPYFLRTSDGILAFEVLPIRRINLRGNIPFVFAEPPPET